MIIKREEFRDNLAMFKGIVDKTGLSDTLHAIKLTISEGEIEMIGTDGELCLALIMEHGGDAIDKVVCVPHSLLHQTVDKMKVHELHAEVDAMSFSFGDNDGMEFNVDCLPVAEYPDIVLETNGEHTAAIDSQKLLNAISYCEQSVNVTTVDRSRLEVADGGFNVLSTDNYSASIYRGDGCEASSSKNIDIPCVAIKAVKSLLELCDTVKIYDSANYILFDAGNVKLRTPKVSQNFPDVEKVFAPDSIATCTIDRTELIDAIRLAEIYSDNRESIGFNISEKEVTVFEAKSKVKVPCEADNKITFRLGSRQSLKKLSALSCDKVVLRYCEIREGIGSVKFHSPNEDSYETILACMTL